MPAFLGAEAGPGSLGVDEGENRHVKLLRQLHQAQRLPITFGVGHSKIATKLLLRVATALVADRHHRVVVEARPAADDGGIVAEGAISMQLDEIGEGEADVVGGEGAPRIARDLHSLERREILVDLFPQVGELPLEGLDRLGNA